MEDKSIKYQFCNDTGKEYTKKRRQFVSAVTILCLSPGSHCLLNSNSMVIRLCALIGMSCRLAAYIIKAGFE